MLLQYITLSKTMVNQLLKFTQFIFIGSVIDEDWITKLLEIIIFVRFLRVISLFYELQKFRIIIETIVNLMSPFWALITVQFSVNYVYCLIGQALAGGMVDYDNKQILWSDNVPDIYIFVNFNDMGNGLLTLFDLMVLNNWQVIA